MIADLLKKLPVRQGHFVLESGYHTDLWITLDALFVSPRNLAPLVDTLAGKLKRHDASAICGPFQGGAFLAQALAAALGVDFYFSRPVSSTVKGELFGAEYRLPEDFRRRLNGQRVALVDDVISAGSSVRATAAVLMASNARVVAIGTLVVLGRIALDHFGKLGIPVESVGQEDFNLWPPSLCPLCRERVPLEDQVHER